jgi:hypothetical protein
LIASGPTDLRRLFNLFLLYDPTTGIEGLINRVDLSGFDRRKVFHAVLGRRPENIMLCRTPDNYNAKGHFSSALHSPEFQGNIIKLLLRAFPDRKRLIFIHIPKCAGTDLISKVVGRYPSINNTLTSDIWTTKSRLFEAIQKIVAEIYNSDTLFVYGHIGLGWLMSQDLLRLQDDCFTVIRNPLEMILSQVNYILMRIFATDALRMAPDVQQWLSILGLQRDTIDASMPKALSLARSVLRNKDLTPSNVMTRQLGVSASGTEPNATSAMNNLILANIEITDTTRYDNWNQNKFGHSRATRMNKSISVLRSEDLSDDDRDYISSITAEDQELYNTILKLLDKSKSLSIRGGNLN